MMREDIAILIGASSELDDLRRKLCGLGWRAVQPCHSLVGVRRFLVSLDETPVVLVVAAGTRLSSADRAVLEPVLADAAGYAGITGTIGLGSLTELAELGCDVYTLDVDEAVRLAESYSATVCQRTAGRAGKVAFGTPGNRITDIADDSSATEARRKDSGPEPVERRMTWPDGIADDGGD